MLSLQRFFRAAPVCSSVPLLGMSAARFATGAPGTKKTIFMPEAGFKRIKVLDTKGFNDLLQTGRFKTEKDEKFFNKLNASRITFEVPEEKGQPPRTLFDGKPSPITHISPVASVCFSMAGQYGDYKKKENAQFCDGDASRTVDGWVASRRVIKLDSTPLAFGEKDNTQMLAYISFLEEVETTFYEHLLSNISHYPKVEELLKEAKAENPGASDLHLLMDHPTIAPVRYPRDESRLQRIKDAREVWFRINSKDSPNLRFDAPSFRKPVTPIDPSKLPEREQSLYEEFGIVKTELPIYDHEGAQINAKTHKAGIIGMGDLVSVEAQIEPYFERPGRENKIGLRLHLVAATRWIRKSQKPITSKDESLAE